MTISELRTILLGVTSNLGEWLVLVDEGDGERSPVEVIEAEWDIDARALILRIDG